MNLVQRWLDPQLSQPVAELSQSGTRPESRAVPGIEDDGSQVSQVSQSLCHENAQVDERKEESSIVRVATGPGDLSRARAHAHATPPAKAAKVAKVQAWVDRPDVVTVVEDLADEGMRPGRISRTLGLTRAEVVTVLRRAGR
jgi:hypothetical protein